MEKKQIVELHYNYVPPMGTSTEVYPDQYEIAKIGLNDVEEITEHPARGEGDKWYYDIIKLDGSVIRTFAPHKVFFEPIPF